jgi:hypothetical protein
MITYAEKIRPDQKHKLKAVAEKRGMTSGEMLRRWIDRLPEVNK